MKAHLFKMIVWCNVFLVIGIYIVCNNDDDSYGFIAGFAYTLCLAAIDIGLGIVCLIVHLIKKRTNAVLGEISGALLASGAIVLTISAPVCYAVLYLPQLVK